MFVRTGLDRNKIEQITSFQGLEGRGVVGRGTGGRVKTELPHYLLHSFAVCPALLPHRY